MVQGDTANNADQALANFSDEFKALENQLQVRVLTRVQQERDLQRRALLYRFPRQFAGIPIAAKAASSAAC